MKVLMAFLQMIRWVNLLFIVITQVLFRYCIILPVFEDSGIEPLLTDRLFILLVIASVLIAAAGYIINDYFDLNIDQVNKPEKMVVGKIIKRRWAIFWHLTFSGIGVLLSLYIGWKVNNVLLGLANLLCVAMLWFYSTTFKKKLLIGNVIISLLSAWVVMALYFAEWERYFHTTTDAFDLRALSRVFRFAFLYTGFAFIISLVREVVKDVEDMAGDSKYGCRTMPIVWGVHVSKVFAATWLIVLIAALCIIQFYVLQFRWWLSALFCIFLIVIPLIIALKNLFAAKKVKDFHRLSSLIKFIMLTGILSMFFFRIYS